jgi:hypothetical protein
MMLLEPPVLAFGVVELGKLTHSLPVRLRNTSQTAIEFDFDAGELDLSALAIEYPDTPWTIPPGGAATLSIALRPHPTVAESRQVRLSLAVIFFIDPDDRRSVSIEIECETRAARRFAYPQVEVPWEAAGRKGLHRFIVLTDERWLEAIHLNRVPITRCIGVPAGTESNKVNESTPVDPGELLLSPAVSLLDRKWARVLGYYLQLVEFSWFRGSDRVIGNTMIGDRLASIARHALGLNACGTAGCIDCPPPTKLVVPKRGEVLRTPRGYRWDFFVVVAPTDVSGCFRKKYDTNEFTVMVPANRSDFRDEPDLHTERIVVLGLGSIDIYPYTLGIHWYVDQSNGAKAESTGYSLGTQSLALIATRAAEILGVL